MKITIGIIKCVQYGSSTTWDMHLPFPDGYILASEVLEVEIEMLPESDQVIAEVESLQEAKRDVLAKAQITANDIDEKIQSKLAITNQS